VGIRSYTYTYDGLARLKTASYSGLGSENYGIAGINYDRNGNITQLQRNGKTGGSFGLMDNLSYTYSGNRLTSVNDGVSGNNEVDFVKRGSGGYTYYANGALKSDENEQITNITYNTYLNLPEEINLSDGRWIRYTYDGDGELIRTQYSTGEYWEYVDGSGGVPLVFKNGQPYQVSVPDGRAIFESGVWKLEFDYKDHLGNTRVSFKEGSSGVVQTARTDFDPWGVRLNGTGIVNAYQNRWELQGHEKESTFNLNRINFGARVYNPTIGRFDRPDRYSEKYTSLSTYQYAANNPLRYVDINGDSLWITHKGNNYLYNDGKLYNSDGSPFEGKMKGFLKKTFNALNEMNTTEAGSTMLGDLSSSTNNFFIVKSNVNEFREDRKSLNASYAQQINTDDTFQHQRPAPNGGAGGTIYWNPHGASVWTMKGYQSNATTNLGHELFHAYDANNGLMDGRIEDGLKRNEWQASYRENLLRGQLKLPYREYYKSQSNNGVISPMAPRILDVNNNPIRPSWLPK